MRLPFAQVDVFAAAPFAGNPVAVVFDADGLDDESMARIARWTNLSETTFVLAASSPAADYRVRIFTPATELPFAGHPTLGTCHAWLEHFGRRSDAVTQECAAGLIRLRRIDGRLAFAGPPLLRTGPVDESTRAAVIDALGVDAGDVTAVEWADNGPGWIAVLVRDADAVLAVRPRPTELAIGLAGPHPPGAPCAVEVRAFFPLDGKLLEDPVTGSLNAALGALLTSRGDVHAPYVAAQGRVLGRQGEVHVSLDEAGGVWVAGDTVTCVTGELTVPGQ